MAFTSLENYNEPPKRICNDPIGNVLRVFPPKPLQPHDGAGYIFRSNGCNLATAYSPEFCQPGDMKMAPSHYGPAKHALVNVIQSAFECSTIGATDEELREQALSTLDRNLWRSVDADLNTLLAADAVTIPGGPLTAICALAAAQQFLAQQSYCGTGVIMGPASWINQLNTNHVNPYSHGKTPNNEYSNADYYKDLFGNYIMLSAFDTGTIYAFDSEVEVRVGDVLLLDQFAPAIERVNQRIVRAEKVYTIAIDPCAIGKLTLIDCAAAGSGGGGGGGSVMVTNFPANQNVTVTNFPPDTDVLPSPLPVTVVNFPADTDTPVIETITSQQFEVVSGIPWTPAAIPAGRLVGLSHTVVTGTVTVVDSDGTTIAAIPQGFTQNWNVQDDHDTLTPVQSITADDATSQTIVTMVVANP